MPRQGRDPQRETFWREVVAGHRKSGLSVRAFCRQRGLSEPNFYAWRRTLDERDRTTRVQPAKFVPVEVVSEPMVEVVLPRGVVVRLPSSSEPTAIARLVTALESASC
jgi:transposase-like protein